MIRRTSSRASRRGLSLLEVVTNVNRFFTEKMGAPTKSAMALVIAALLVAGCKLDTSTPSGWQTRGPRSSAGLPASDEAAPAKEQMGVAEGSGSRTH